MLCWKWLQFNINLISKAEVAQKLNLIQTQTKNNTSETTHFQDIINILYLKAIPQIPTLLPIQPHLHPRPRRSLSQPPVQISKIINQIPNLISQSIQNTVTCTGIPRFHWLILIVRSIIMRMDHSLWGNIRNAWKRWNLLLRNWPRVCPFRLELSNSWQLRFRDYLIRLKRLKLISRIKIIRFISLKSWF